MDRSKHLKTYVGLSAFFVAGSAAFFSVFGLSNLFAGANSRDRDWETNVFKCLLLSILPRLLYYI